MGFLYGIAQDEGPAAAGVIVKRPWAKTTVVANYRNRLLAAEVSEAPGLQQGLLSYTRALGVGPAQRLRR
jgi:hypothetical protein